MKTGFPSIFCLAPKGWAILIEFYILEIVFVVTGDEEMKRGKNALAILSQNRETRTWWKLKL